MCDTSSVRATHLAYFIANPTTPDLRRMFPQCVAGVFAMSLF